MDLIVRLSRAFVRSRRLSHLTSANYTHLLVRKEEGHTVPRRPAFNPIPRRSSLERIANVQHIRRVYGEVVKVLEIADFVYAAERAEVEFDFVGDDVCAVEADGVGEGWEEECC